jgi:hypothetical protein
MNVQQLRSELKSKKMKLSGKKKELVQRLVDPFPSIKDVFAELKMARRVSVEDKSRWSEKIELAFEIHPVFGSCSVDGLALSPEGMKLWENLIVFTSEWKRKCQPKTTVLKWNSGFAASLDRLVNIKAECWNQEDKKEILEMFCEVRLVDMRDGDGSNPGIYSRFQSELLRAFAVDLEFKLLMDPEVVVVDLPETNAARINEAIAAFVPVPILAVVPAKDNPSTNPFVWSFANFDEANHWIAFLKGRINGIRCLQYTTAGPGALY